MGVWGRVEAGGDKDKLLLRSGSCFGAIKYLVPLSYCTVGSAECKRNGRNGYFVRQFSRPDQLQREKYRVITDRADFMEKRMLRN